MTTEESLVGIPLYCLCSRMVLDASENSTGICISPTFWVSFLSTRFHWSQEETQSFLDKFPVSLLGQNNQQQVLKEGRKGFLRLTVWGCSPPWRESHDNGSGKQLVMLYSQSGSRAREQRMWHPAGLLLCVQCGMSKAGVGTTHNHGGSLHLM